MLHTTPKYNAPKCTIDEIRATYYDMIRKTGCAKCTAAAFPIPAFGPPRFLRSLLATVGSPNQPPPPPSPLPRPKTHTQDARQHDTTRLQAGRDEMLCSSTVHPIQARTKGLDPDLRLFPKTRLPTAPLQQHLIRTKNTKWTRDPPMTQASYSNTASDDKKNTIKCHRFRGKGKSSRKLGANVFRFWGFTYSTLFIVLLFNSTTSRGTT